jgi:ABC-type sugar transport system permease subunit
MSAPAPSDHPPPALTLRITLTDRHISPAGKMLCASRIDNREACSAVTSGGSARPTEILVYKVFRDGVEGLDLGGSSAQSVILMLLVIALTVLQFRYVERRGQYQ